MTNLTRFFASLCPFNGIEEIFLLIFSKKVTYYSCPKCNIDITEGQKICNRCETSLSWENVWNNKHK